MDVRSGASVRRGPGLPGLRGISAYACRRLAECGRVVHVPTGWSPVSVGEPADAAYLVLEGRLRVARGDREVTTLGPGSLVGGTGVPDPLTRRARLTALEPVRALAWPTEEFQQLREELPDLEALLQHVVRQRRQEHDTSS